MQWRVPKDMPPSTTAIHSPDDTEAHYSSKRSVIWVGYKAHVTESCDRSDLRQSRYMRSRLILPAF